MLDVNLASRGAPPVPDLSHFVRSSSNDGSNRDSFAIPEPPPPTIAAAGGARGDTPQRPPG
eukprot:6055566-Prymnesium_polylepis.1